MKKRSVRTDLSLEPFKREFVGLTLDDLQGDSRAARPVDGPVDASHPSRTDLLAEIERV